MTQPFEKTDKPNASVTPPDNSKIDFWKQLNSEKDEKKVINAKLHESGGIKEILSHVSDDGTQYYKGTKDKLKEVLIDIRDYGKVLLSVTIPKLMRPPRKRFQAEWRTDQLSPCLWSNPNLAYGKKLGFPERAENVEDSEMPRGFSPEETERLLFLYEEAIGEIHQFQKKGGSEGKALLKKLNIVLYDMHMLANEKGKRIACDNVTKQDEELENLSKKVEGSSLDDEKKEEIQQIISSLRKIYTGTLERNRLGFWYAVKNFEYYIKKMQIEKDHCEGVAEQKGSQPKNDLNWLQSNAETYRQKAKNSHTTLENFLVPTERFIDYLKSKNINTVIKQEKR